MNIYRLVRANETKEESIVENEIFNCQVGENGFQNLNAKLRSYRCAMPARFTRVGNAIGGSGLF